MLFQCNMLYMINKRNVREQTCIQMTRKDSLFYFSYKFNLRFILYLQHLTLLEMAQLKEGFEVDVSSSFSARLQLSTINNTDMA